MFLHKADRLLHRFTLCTPVGARSLIDIIMKNKLTVNFNASGYSLMDVIQKTHAKEYRTFRRQPIGVIRHDPESKGKSVEEYVIEAKGNAGVLLDQFKYEVQDTQKTEDVKVGMTYDSEDGVIHRNQQHKSMTSKRGRESQHYESLKQLHFQLYDESRGFVKKIFENAKSSKMREKHDIFLVEGWRQLAEGLKAGLRPVAIFYSRSRLLANMAPILLKTEQQLAELLSLYPVYKTPYKILQTWTSLKTSPGIVAAFNLSSAISLCQTPRESSFPLTVILDKIKDPANLGSIIRSLVAVGVEKILIMKGCCDPWDTKVLRASSGGNFRMHCTFKTPWSKIANHVPSSATVYLADSFEEQEVGGDDDVDDKDTITTNFSHINEGKLMNKYNELKEQSLSESNERSCYIMDGRGNKVLVNESFSNMEHLDLFSNVMLPSASFDNLKIYSSSENKEPVVLIIGGETGLSNEAKKFALENGGLQLSIPMSNGIESLNSAVAVSILVYEFRRQFVKSNRIVKNSKEQFG